ncbi:MAG: hypothetical protein ACI33P_12820 [Lysinibacillus sp.]
MHIEKIKAKTHPFKTTFVEESTGALVLSFFLRCFIQHGTDEKEKRRKTVRNTRERNTTIIDVIVRFVIVEKKMPMLPIATIVVKRKRLQVAAPIAWLTDDKSKKQ